MSPDLRTRSPSELTAPRWLLALLLILVVAGGLRAYLFYGYSGLDDGEYARMAYEMANGDFEPRAYEGPAVFPLRVGLIAPAAVLIKTFGFSEWVSVLWPFALSLLSMVVVYVGAGTLFGPVAGLVAAGAIALAPEDVENASRLLPDLPGALFVGLGIVLLMLGERKEGRNALIGFGAAAGLCFGISWLNKAAVAYMAPFVLAYLIISFRAGGRAVLPLWASFVAASFGVLFAEIGVYRWLTGDALFRFHEIERNYDQWVNGFFTEGSIFGWEEGESRSSALFRRLFVTGPQALLIHAEYVCIPAVGLAGAIYGWVKRDRAFLIPGLWLLCVLLMFNFSSSSSTEYLPLALYSRYIYPVLIPSAILMGGLVGRQTPAALAALSERRVPWGVWPSVAAVTLVGLYAAWIHQYPIRHRAETVLWWTAEVEHLSEEIAPGAPLYADTLSLRGLNFFSGYPESIEWVDFERLGGSDELAEGSLVLVHPAYLNWLQVNRGMWLSDVSGYKEHDFYDEAPADWTVVWENDPVVLYRVQ